MSDIVFSCEVPEVGVSGVIERLPNGRFLPTGRTPRTNYFFTAANTLEEAKLDIDRLLQDYEVPTARRAEVLGLP